MGKQCSNNTLSQGSGGYPLVSLLTVFFFFLLDIQFTNMWAILSMGLL